MARKANVSRADYFVLLNRHSFAVGGRHTDDITSDRRAGAEIVDCELHAELLERGKRRLDIRTGRQVAF